MDVDLTQRVFARRQVANPLVVARDGDEALAMFHRWESGERIPLLILLDLNLPRVAGMEVLRQLKSHPRFRGIPVVVLTTSSDEGEIRTAYTLGANSYIVKPVDFDCFVEVAYRIQMYWSGLNLPWSQTEEAR